MTQASSRPSRVVGCNAVPTTLGAERVIVAEAGDPQVVLASPSAVSVNTSVYLTTEVSPYFASTSSW